jgi:iron-sulfur cluster repair protein YtfE (RIC family)
MSLFDKAIAAVTPPPSAEKRAEARKKARAAAKPGDWLSLILEHHLEVEAAFANAKSAPDGASRRKALEKLGALLNGHSMAEEAVVYPALAQAGEKGHAETAYAEQVGAKMNMAELENLEPMSQAWLDKLGHIEGAVAHHVYEEEGTWFPELERKASAAVQAKVTKRYKEEFDRYIGGEAKAEALSHRAAGESRSFGDRPST